MYASKIPWWVFVPHVGADFATSMTILTFLPGSLNETEMCLNISITDDDRVEYNETFNITLTVDNPLDTINGAITAVTDVTIVDNDGMVK